VSKKLRNLKIEEVSLVDQGANQDAQILLVKRDPNVEPKMPEQDTAKELADAKAALAKATEELAALKKQEDTSPPDLATARKAYTEISSELSKVRTELQGQLETVNKELEDARAEVLKIQAQRRREKFIKRVQELPNLPGAPADDFAEILDVVEKAVTPKQFEKVNTLLSSWNAIIGKSKIFEELGRSEVGAFSGAEGTLHALAKEKAATSGGKLSYEKAYQMVLAENPTLYKRYLAEKES
jgi:chromosome segregation ATPase